MNRKVSSLIVIVSQLLMVGIFFVIGFSSDIQVEKHVSTIHNENLNKIATAVSLLFEEDIVPIVDEMEELVLEELPSGDVIVIE